MRLIGRMWGVMGSLQVSVILFALVTIDLFIGYLCIEGRTVLFQPMNDVGLLQWLMTYGRQNLIYTGWFYFLLPLLLLLAFNTLICTYTKLHYLFCDSTKRLFAASTRLTLSIHLMHLAVILMLAGYLMSYTMGDVQRGVTLSLGRTVRLPDSGRELTLDRLELIPYTSGRIASFSDRYMNVQAQLTVATFGKAKQEIEIGLNRPALVNGRLLLLHRFNPTYVGRMSSSHYVVLDIRRDYGGFVTIIGMGAFLFGLLGYLFHRTLIARRRRSL